MKNFEISDLFGKIADLLDIRGENPFRIRAYRRAAFSIEAVGRDIASLSHEGLTNIPGIGDDLASKIEEYLSTGRISAYEDLKRDTPESLIDLLGVPGLGPKTVGLLFKEYGVKGIEDLDRLAATHQLVKIPGIREKTEAKIIKGIEMLRRESARLPIARVRPVAEDIVRYLKEHAPVGRISIAGSIRRWKDTIRDIDIISTSKEPGEVMKVFTHMPGVQKVLAKGPTKSSVVVDAGIQVDIRVVEEVSYGAALAYFTGSKTHNIRLREIASRAGLKINEYGIIREKDGKRIGGRSEEDIYRILGLQFIPPELREDTGEIEAAAEGGLPDLVELGDIRGDLHAHSSWSDGNMKVEELMAVGPEKGYRYIALTDHTKGLGVARGLNEEKLLEQIKVIDSLNRKAANFRILSGAEVNIRSDGNLDLDEEILSRLDVVIASVHSGFRQPGEKITARIIAALKNPHVSILGHPSGRLIGEREAYDVDMEMVLRTARETGTAVEINAYPFRLDLSDTFVRTAKSLGVTMVVSTDSHNRGQFDNMKYGVAVAKRGWLGKKDVANTLEAPALLRLLKKKKG